VPRAWREGDLVLLAWTPASLDLAAEAALVDFLWRAAPSLSLAHDVGAGGLDVALAEAALWSSVGAEVELPEAATGVVLACRPDRAELLHWPELVRLGVVGGDHLLGYPLGELARARESA
jgi:hypothetical protein